MLSIVFDINELKLQSKECIKFVRYAMSDLNTIFISDNTEKDYEFFEKYDMNKYISESEKYISIEEFLEINKDNTEEWFLIITDKKFQFESYGLQFAGCPYEFWGSMQQFEKNSFTEHAKKKLIYNELSWLYMDSIANDTGLEVEFLKKIFKKYNVNKILDCCCGVGRHACRLGENGFKVTGVDASVNQINTALKKNNNENVEYYVNDARNFTLPQKYDAAICMWTTYNYFSKEKDILAFLNNISAHLNDKGILVLDSKNILNLESNRLYHRRTQRDDIDLILLVYKRIMGMIQNSQYFYFINNGQEKDFYIDEEFVRFYTLDELKSLNNAMFKLIHVYGDFEGNDYDIKKSERMITVWQKYIED